MTAAAPSGRARLLASWPARLRRAPSWPAVVLALVSYVPLLLTAPRVVGADTKQYLYLDPGRLLSRAPYLWDEHTGMGGVTHQNIGYLLPQGPWYWVLQELGAPDWVAQRLWTGSLLFAAATGVLFLLRTFGWRDRAAFLAAMSYTLSPYVLEYVARTSAILQPWAGLPWMLALLVRGLRFQQAMTDGDLRGQLGADATGWRGRVRSRGRYAAVAWRYPALFALVLAVISGTNASSLIFAGIAPVLWIPFALAQREVRFRPAVAYLARALVLSIAVCVWWMGGLTDQAGYGLNILRYSETVKTVASTSQASEVLRGLGNWFFYGRDTLSLWVQPSASYTRVLWVIAVSFAVPLAAFAGAALLRWRHRAYFLVLVLVGTALAVGVFPYAHPSPGGGLFKAFAAGSTAGLALRSTPRAVPLVALGLGVLLAGAVEALWQRLPARDGGRPTPRRRGRRLAPLVYAAVLALVVLDMSPLWRGQFVDANLRRPEALPSYLTQLAAHLQASPAVDGEQTRVLELPGADFAYFTWGQTLDDPLPGLMDRPYVSRLTIPEGEPASAALVRALDEPLQEGVEEPAALAPIARLMGVGDLVLRSDLQWQRFLLPQPVSTWAQVGGGVNGLGAPQPFGPPVGDAAGHQFLDEVGLAQTAADADPPAMADFPVDGAVPIVRAEHAADPLLVAGDSVGLVDASAAGMLDTTGVVRFAATHSSTPVPAGASLLLTDSNQKRAERWNTVQQNFGYVETATGVPLAQDTNDARLPVFPGESTADQTVAVLTGVQDVEATSYGNAIGYAPSDRPFYAVDGDPTTAWRVGAFADPRGESLRTTLLHPEDASTITLQQPPGGATRTITQARLTFTGGPGGTVTEPVALGPTSLTAPGQQVTVPAAARGYTAVEFTVVQTSNGTLPRYDGQSGVGLAELSIPGVRADEVLRLPTDLFSAAGGNGLADPLSILLTRDRADPQQPFKTDTEPSMARQFTLPTARTFDVGGTARLSAQSLDAVLDGLVGRTGSGPAVTATASSALPGSLDARASSAFDGDPATAWTDALGGSVGSWLQVTSPTPRTESSMDLSVVADGRHSVPTQVRLVVDGTQVRDLTLPAIADRAGVDATTTVPVSFPAVTGRSFRIEITGERREDTTDYFKHTPEELPVAIADAGLPGLTVTPAATTLPGTCRSDLLSVDGTPVPIAITGTTAAGVARDGLSLRLCGPPLTLAAGTHVLQTARGQATGIDLDRLELASQAGGAAADPAHPFPGQVRTAGAPTIDVTSSGPVSYRLSVTGATPGTPFWLVLGQSLSPAWKATVGGRSLGASQLIDGYANGWLVDPTTSGFTVSLDWTAQQKVWDGVGISVVALLGCLAIVAGPGGRRRSRAIGLGALAGDDALALQAPSTRGGRPASWRRAAIAVLAAAAVGAAMVSPTAGAVVLVAAVLAAVVPYGRAVLRAGAVAVFAASAVYVLQAQARFRFPTTSEWVDNFHKVATLSWLVVPLLLADVLLGWAARDLGETDGAD